YRSPANPGLDPRKRINRQPHHRRRWIRPQFYKGPPERQIENGLADECQTPQPRLINVRNDDLPSGKFQKLEPRAIAVRWNQAQWNKDNPHSGGARRQGHGKVIANRPVPRFANVYALENLAAQRHRSAPGKVPGMAAKRGDDRGIPDGTEQGR